MTVHNFRQSLALSHVQESAEWWKAIYEQAFPGHLSAVSVPQDGWAQRGGIDRVITLKSAKNVYVDEKVRDVAYSDILLEQWSDRDNEKPGWMQKELACDFIAYVILPHKTCYMLPFISLRRAWLTNGRDWIKKAKAKADGFRVVDAPNEGYVTRSIAVPIPTLLGAISQSHPISWGDE